jgi:hypothetical protein
MIGGWMCVACSGGAQVTPEAVDDAQSQAPEVDRATFNRLAQHLDIPLFQKADGDVVRFRSGSPWKGAVDDAKVAVASYAAATNRDAALPSEEQSRRALVRAELDAGRPTLLESDFRGESAAVRGFLEAMVKAAEGIEVLFAIQKGSAALHDQVPADDPASRALFERNQGPWCEAPTSTSAVCSAIPGVPSRVFGLYPAEVQQDEDFCARLEADHPEVLSPFTVVQQQDGGLAAVPYTEAWTEPMAEVSQQLSAAADAIAPEGEEALVAYLRAAAKAFTDNDWFAADAAWAEMNQQNSRWYLRVAPDETYYEPCGIHAGFALVLAEVDPAGLAWQSKFEPVKRDMETALAELAGPPYVARAVGFDLPEFIRIVLNAGNSRSPAGATIGQSLPNWGPVSDAGGRTVAMTNISTDPDSVAAKRTTFESLLCDTEPARVIEDPEPLLISTLLHEAAHNLGPAGEYKVDGQTDSERFGGSLASMLEELKAQSAALYLTDWLAERDVIDETLAPRMHTADVTWALGQLSRGMYTPSGRSRAYGQLAMIQMGFLLDAGALAWHGDRTAANGQDVGCLTIDDAALPAAVHELATKVLTIKSTGDRATAEAWKAQYVDNAQWAEWRELVAERFARMPQSSFVYRVAR